MLWICPEDKTEGHTYKAQIDGIAEDKKNIGKSQLFLSIRSDMLV
ncbi:MAG: hypothetical protein OEM28_13270 [Nitrosopumilus sp.]|nr:hypothetical protein [Nitrosopumilus sp.]MDH3488371.1 hypothetical protein [Nitrosopumilus sp.]